MSIMNFIKPFRSTIVWIALLTFGQIIADLLLPNYMADIVDKGIARGDIPFIFHTGGIMLLIAFAGICCAVTAGFLASRTALSIGRNLRGTLFRKITSYSLNEFDQIGTSSLITRTTNDVQQIQQTTFMVLRMMMRAPLMCIGGVIMAVQKDTKLSLLLLAILPIVTGIIYLVTVKAVPLFRMVQKKIDRINLVLRENLVGIRIIRAFSRLGYERKRFRSANDDLTGTSVRANRLMALLNPSMTLGMNLLTIAIVWFASFRIDKGDLQVGDMMAFIQYATQIFMSLTMITMLFVLLPRAYASAERIEEVFERQAEISDPSRPQTWNETNPRSIVFKNVTFRYHQAENPAVNDVSFSIRQGETLAIIGGTGSGKSALIGLIPRYYDVESGSIEIDGVDIRDMAQAKLRSRIGLVPQLVTIFSGTINENIRMGKEDATEAEIIDACRVAQADEFIRNLPKQYETEIAQGGTNLSGGQKQRLSIARALVRKPGIYLFDDSFSALDFKTDAALRAALQHETGNAIVIIVAQRISSIKYADKILIMDNGKIVGEGRHNELIRTNEIYREIAFSQLSEEEL